MFSVLWVRSTLDDLSRIRQTRTASEYELVRAAIQEIERRLQVNPEDEGESRAVGQRISFVPPLGFTFSVLPAQRQVLVSHVWSFGKAPSP